jgi:hypothetical protein
MDEFDVTAVTKSREHRAAHQKSRHKPSEEVMCDAVRPVPPEHSGIPVSVSPQR